MTYREIIYIINDLCKEFSDDATYTEDHILFLINKYRGALLSQHLTKKIIVPRANYQTINVQLNPLSSDTQNVVQLKSNIAVPDLLPIGNPVITTNTYYTSTTSVDTTQTEEHVLNMPLDVNLISSERMRWVGYQKHLDKILYCSIDPQTKYMFAKTSKKYLDFDLYSLEISITGVFDDAVSASKLHPDFNDLFDMEFPLESSMVPNLIQAVMKDLVGANYRPKDDINNATDDLSRLAYFISKNSKSTLAKQLDTE